MMTKDELKEIEQYCAKHGLTFKQRLNELNIPESNFYYARRMYSREDMVPSTGEFVLLSTSRMPFPIAHTLGNGRRKGKQAQQAESYMTVELRSEEWYYDAHPGEYDRRAPAGDNDGDPLICSIRTRARCR